MIGMDSKHCQIVVQSLSGERAIDEQSIASIEVLGERLERVNKLGAAFSGIEFSPEALELVSRKREVAVC